MSSIVEFQVIRRAAEPHGVRVMSVALPRRANPLSKTALRRRLLQIKGRKNLCRVLVGRVVFKLGV